MDNDTARHELIEVLALVQEQMADLAVVEMARAALSATATGADGTVVVTVNVDGVVTKTAVSESYLNEHELADLGRHVTAAAQAAARDVERKAAELLAPLAERRARFPSLSGVVEGAPDIRDLVSLVDQTPQRVGEVTHDDGKTAADYPTVRSWR